MWDKASRGGEATIGGKGRYCHVGRRTGGGGTGFTWPAGRRFVDWIEVGQG